MTSNLNNLYSLILGMRMLVPGFFECIILALGEKTVAVTVIIGYCDYLGTIHKV